MAKRVDDEDPKTGSEGEAGTAGGGRSGQGPGDGPGVDAGRSGVAGSSGGEDTGTPESQNSEAERERETETGGQETGPEGPPANRRQYAEDAQGAEVKPIHRSGRSREDVFRNPPNAGQAQGGEEPDEPAMPLDPGNREPDDGERMYVISQAIMRLNPQNPEEFSVLDIPLTAAVQEMVEFSITEAEVHAAWASLHPGNRNQGAAEVKKSTAELDGKTVTRSDFTREPPYMDGKQVVSSVWRHKGTGTKYYEPVPAIKRRGLPIYPFAVE